MKNLKIMPDYYCSPIWIEGEDTVFYNIEPKEIHLLFGPSLGADIQLWQDKFDTTLNSYKYDETLNSFYSPASRFKTEKDSLDFEKTGVKLWLEINKKMSETCHITYFSVLQDKLYDNFEKYKEDIDLSKFLLS